MARSDIEWLARPGTVPESWNPVTGCNMNGKRVKASPGCDHCWAERMARRLNGRCGYPKMPHHFDVTLHEDRLSQPSKWRKPRTVFVASMGDLFHEDVPDEFLCEVWLVMNRCHAHVFLVLTKRPERMMAWLSRSYGMGKYDPQPLVNVWLGVTIEKPEHLWRAHYLRQTPAAVRFLSLEPLLASFAEYPGVTDDMDWIIAGGESGPGARPAHPDWFRDLRDQCQAAGVAFFFKSWGAWLPNAVEYGCYQPEANYNRPHKLIGGTNLPEVAMARVGKKAAGRLLDGQEWSQWPT